MKRSWRTRRSSSERTDRSDPHALLGLCVADVPSGGAIPPFTLPRSDAANEAQAFRLSYNLPYCLGLPEAGSTEVFEKVVSLVAAEDGAPHALFS